MPDEIGEADGTHGTKSKKLQTGYASLLWSNLSQGPCSRKLFDYGYLDNFHSLVSANGRKSWKLESFVCHKNYHLDMSKIQQHQKRDITAISGKLRMPIKHLISISYGHTKESAG